MKVGWVDESTAHEALALSAWKGNGAVLLVNAQPEIGALLLERLDSQRSLETAAIEEAVSIAGQLLRRLAIAPPDGIPSIQEIAPQLTATMAQRWAQFGRPMSRRLLDQACVLAVEFGASARRLLVNYDLIYADVLAGEREPWLAVDPKVVAGDPEYGVAQLLWRRLEEMQAQGGLARHWETLIEAAALDSARTRAWTLVRCVDYWLWGVSVGLTEDPARCATITDWLVSSS